MPTMQLLRLGDLHLIYKIQEIMEDNGFTSGNYQVIDGYPNEIDLRDNELYPTLTVSTDVLFGQDVELGSGQWPACQVAIDVFAKTDSQRDDVSYIVWKNLNESVNTLYDFNESFPSGVGGSMYNGISTLGTWGVDNLTILNLDPEDSPTDMLKHHSLIDGIMYLPNI